ncbi:integrin alpha-1 [Brienomyrus brachyistius]|uniref:integrin alpha-1 n=1 Tax=Brienomyrus brachyistius TaxID=42636 RepID=UPI0020B31186|nr:integrin alpha-1 [Brienomyrus brachyistius]XP_048875079.1 integrin alpha-1 [Brienomyrus brachyistius]
MFWSVKHCSLIIIIGCLRCLWSFNVDEKNAMKFSGSVEDMFGYTVQQFENNEGKWILIGSPLTGQPAHRTGDVYKCPVGRSDSKCIKLELPENTTIPDSNEVKDNMTMGTTLVTNPDGGFLACGPLYARKCGSQQYTTGICSNVSASFQVMNSISPPLQVCDNKLDIVMVLDGSNSIYPWSSIKDFLVKFLKNIDVGPTLSQVGIVSYGDEVSHVFNLSQFNNTRDLVAEASKIPQKTGTKTNTFLAIETARREAFTKERGARPGVKKVMVIVTDGESHDNYKSMQVMNESNKDGIERFSIAVLGDYYRQRKSEKDIQTFIKEIQSIASPPIQDHFFNVSDEVALLNITESLGSKIFALEGTTGNHTTSFKLEMSQAGFSTHVSKEGVMFGAVGAYDWNGTVVMKKAQDFIIPSEDAFHSRAVERYEGMAGYVGYDVQSASRPKGILYITGAPRYNHTGRVIVYKLDGNNIKIKQILKGEQIGSYFGSVLQTVDVDNDSYTDILLVGAPMYMGSERDEQGQVYVYRINETDMFEYEMTLKPIAQPCCTSRSHSSCKTINKNEPCGSRFGTAIASVTDLNLDGLGDVVIGAPLENDHRGAVYIYHGAGKSLKKQFVQRIASGGDGEKMKFFGQSIHGVLDLNGDGITDVTIGGIGGAALFWSRDVAQLRANMSFQPDKINMQTCGVASKNSGCVNITVCFGYTVKSEKEDSFSTDMQYSLTLDSLRAVSRGLFVNKADRKELVEKRISNKDSFCTKHKFYMLDKLDFRDPVMISLVFELVNKDKGPVLDGDLPTSLNKKIALVDCGNNEKCITDLRLEATANITDLVIKANQEKFHVEVKVRNSKDSAYNTKVILAPSKNINFVKIEPRDRDCEIKDDIICAVGYPFLKTNEQDSFKVHFEVNPSNVCEKCVSIDIKVNVTSDSEEPNLNDNSVNIKIPVKYESGLSFSAVKYMEGSHHIIVRESEEFPSVLNHMSMIGDEVNISYTIKMEINQTIPPLTLNITYPFKSPRKNILLYLTNVAFSKNVQCDVSQVDPLKISPQRTHPSHAVKETLGNYTVACDGFNCIVFLCTIPALNLSMSSQVNVTFRVWKATFIKAEFSSLEMTVHATLKHKDTSLFVLSNDNERRDVKIQVSKDSLGGIPLWIIIVSILLGLLILALVIFVLWKAGFFKRKSMEEMKDMKNGQETRT